MCSFFEQLIIDSGISTGMIKTYHPNSNPYIEFFVVNGIMEGQYKQYTESGHLFNIGNYVGGKKHGEFIYYYPTGQSILDQNGNPVR